MIRKQLLGLAVVVLMVCTQAQAQKSDDPLNQFEGVWSGDGKFSGMEAKAQARWERVLSGKFVRLSISYKMKTPDGKAQSFEGTGYYQTKGNGKYEGHWFDSQSNSYPISSTFENGTLVSLWGEPGKYGGKSTYQINSADKTLEIVDVVKQSDGSWKEFSRFKLALNP